MLLIVPYTCLKNLIYSVPAHAKLVMSLISRLGVHICLHKISFIFAFSYSTLFVTNLYLHTLATFYCFLCTIINYCSIGICLYWNWNLYGGQVLYYSHEPPITKGKRSGRQMESFYGLTVRTGDFKSLSLGSTPSRITIFIDL